MTARQHIVLGGVASAALAPFMGTTALVFWAASVLIDIDHYLDFVYHNKFKVFGIRKMFDYHRVLMGYWDRPEFLNLSLLHTYEFIGAAAVAALWTGSEVMAAAAMGFIFHLFLDVLYLRSHGILNKRAHSPIEYWIKKTRLLKKGLRPEELYAMAAEAIKTDARR